MKLKNTFSRRSFLHTGLAAGTAAGLASGVTSHAFAAPPKLTITEVKIVRLKFPGRTLRKRDAILWSGGGQPGMTLVEIYTDQGIVGRSELIGSSEIILSRLANVIKGENPFYVEYLWDKMYRSRKPVAKGIMIECIGSVDFAIWDIIGKALDMPVYRILGGFQDKVRVYAAGGYYRDDKTIADLAREMEGYVNEGFHAVKMKIGGEDFRTDVERVRVVREAIGPDIDILIAADRWMAGQSQARGATVAARRVETMLNNCSEPVLNTAFNTGHYPTWYFLKISGSMYTLLY